MSCIKWISMMLVVSLPRTKRPYALPFLTVLALSKACNEAEGRRHKTTVGRARQMVMQARCRIKDRAIVFVGDGAYTAVSPALCCVGLPGTVTLVSCLRPDTNLYNESLSDQPGKRGPKPEKGKKQTKPEERVSDPLANSYQNHDSTNSEEDLFRIMPEQLCYGT